MLVVDTELNHTVAEDVAAFDTFVGFRLDGHGGAIDGLPRRRAGHQDSDGVPVVHRQ